MPFPIVVTTNSGYPLDQNLYQAVKGMSAAAQIVEPGGLILAAARCNDGFPAHGNFRRLMVDHPSARAILDTITAPGFSLYDQWEAQLLAMILLKAGVGLFSDLPADEVRAAHLEPIADIESRLAEELARRGRRAGGRPAGRADDDSVSAGSWLRARGSGLRIGARLPRADGPLRRPSQFLSPWVRSGVIQRGHRPVARTFARGTRSGGVPRRTQ